MMVITCWDGVLCLGHTAISMDEFSRDVDGIICQNGDW